MKKNLLEPFFFIVVVALIVKNMPYLKKYDIKLKFNIYRSVMCSFFVIKSILYLLDSENILDNAFSVIGELEPLFFKFCFYIFFDIIFTLSRTKKRIDLLIHHLVILAVCFFGFKFNFVGTILPILLLNESISILSGFDRLSLNNNRIIESVLFKKIRKIIITFIRLPIWSLFIYLIFKNKKKLGPSYISTILTIISISIIGLDIYWYKKCSQFIGLNQVKLSK